MKKIKPFTGQCNWTEISFSSHKENLEMFELNNKSIALNTLFYLKILKK